MKLRINIRGLKIDLKPPDGV